MSSTNDPKNDSDGSLWVTRLIRSVVQAMSSTNDPENEQPMPRLVRSVTEYASQTATAETNERVNARVEFMEVMMSNGEDTVTVTKPLDNQG